MEFTSSTCILILHIFGFYDVPSSSKQIACFSVSFEQEIISMNRNGNSANFFSYVCNGKKIKELVASTLNGIPISVRCVSSIIVALNAKFARLLAALANKNACEKQRSPKRVLCFC